MAGFGASRRAARAAPFLPFFFPPSWPGPFRSVLRRTSAAFAGARAAGAARPPGRVAARGLMAAEAKASEIQELNHLISWGE